MPLSLSRCTASTAPVICCSPRHSTPERVTIGCYKCTNSPSASIRTCSALRTNRSSSSDAIVNAPLELCASHRAPRILCHKVLVWFASINLFPVRICFVCLCSTCYLKAENISRLSLCSDLGKQKSGHLSPACVQDKFFLEAVHFSLAVECISHRSLHKRKGGCGRVRSLKEAIMLS